MSKPKSTRTMFRAMLSIFSIVAIMAATWMENSTVKASATGCEFRSGLTVSVEGVSVSIPGGNFCHTIDRTGKHIRMQSAAYIANLKRLGPSCKWRIDFVYEDGRRAYRRDRGPVKQQCNGVARRVEERNKYLEHYGKSCAILYINGIASVTQCHNITPDYPNPYGTSGEALEI